MSLKKKNPKQWLENGERLDDLVIGGLKIFQHERQFCFSLDAVLLAHFATLRAHARIMDLGTGTGVIPLILAARGARHITALELNSEMVRLARKSVAYNAMEERISVCYGDLRQISTLFSAGTFDLVVSNPPYRPLKSGKISNVDGVAAARHEVTAKLWDFVRAAAHLLHTKGRFTMIHLPERLAEIIQAMQSTRIEPKRLRFVQSAAGKKPKMVLIEGVAGAAPGLDVEAPLILYRDFSGGSYSEEMMRYYEGKFS